MKLTCWLLSLMIFALSPMSLAKQHPYGAEFLDKVHKVFFVDGSLSSEKVQFYLNRLYQKRLEVVGIDREGRLVENSILINKFRQRIISREKLIEKITTHEFATAFNEAIRLNKLLFNLANEAEIYVTVQRIFDLEGAIRIEGNRVPIELIKDLSEAALVRWQIAKQSEPVDEASNLINPEDGQFLGVKELGLARQSGVDLSRYNPGKSTFWEPINNISMVDIKEAAIGNYHSMYKGESEERIFPRQGQELHFEEFRYSDTKPKIDAFFRDSKGKKLRLKVKFSGELHADPTVAALMLALGFPADLTRYARDVRLNLGKSYSISDLKRDWESYYNREDLLGRFLIEDAISEAGVNENGENFVIFKEALFEARPEKTARLGPWAFGDNNNDDFREVRALTLLQIWLDNHDIKEMDNNRIILRKEGDQLKTYHMISDLGGALSLFLYEKPDLYFWNVVTENDSSKLNLAFFSMPVNVKNKITFADARWAIRLVAQLTREQIRQAVELGGWPQCVADIYVEKVISRRNDLVSNLDLVGEVLESGQKIEILSVSPKANKLRLAKICDQADLDNDYSSSFASNLEFFLGPIKKATFNVLLDGAREAINGTKKITIKSDIFKLDLGPIAEIIFDPRRDIERNPKPTSERDLYIVKDSLKLGFRFGVAYGIYFDQMFYINVSLAYPTRSMTDARLYNDFLVNLLVGQNDPAVRTPESYVLMVEHSMGQGAGIFIGPGTTPAPLEYRLGTGEILLHRAILDQRNSERFVFYRDKQAMDSHISEANLRLGFLKLPLLETLSNWGRAVGKGFTEEKSRLLPGDINKLQSAMIVGGFSGYTKREKDFYLTNDFSSHYKKWSFLFFGGGSEKRLENISISQTNGDRAIMQYRSQSHSRWDFLGDGEHKRKVVTVYTDPRVIEPRYQISVSVLGIDKHTKDKELDKAYLGFINQFGLSSEPLIPLSPSLNYTRNGNWGHLAVSAELDIHQDGVDLILNLSDQTIYQAFAKKFKTSKEILFEKFERIKQLESTRDSMAGVQQTQVYRRYGISRDEYILLKQLQDFVADMARVRKASTREEKIKVLAEAIKDSLFQNSMGFYDSRIISSITNHLGKNLFHSRNIVTVPNFSEMNLIGDTPLIGEEGRPGTNQLKHLAYSPVTPLDLYNIFESWF